VGIPRRQMHREDRGGLVLSDRCLTIVVARFWAHPSLKKNDLRMSRHFEKVISQSAQPASDLCDNSN
jgi:hypothetical protein